MLDVSVLGPVRASTRGREHHLGGPKQRGLLARLVMVRGRPLAVERLIDEFWAGAPPRDPSHALQARISRLRAALPVEIDLTDGGYRIDPAQVQTDAARFEQLYERGSASLADGALARAAEHVGSALDLWQGEAFAGVPDIAALRAESVRLEKLCVAALADRIDLDLALGRSAAVISELHALVEEHPLAERHWGQLIAALYCEGRVQEALDTFSRARSTFAELLGVEPSSELGRLHAGILQEQSPDALLRIRATASGLGGPAAASGTGVSLGRTRLTSNQPETLAALLRERRMLLLTGPAGIGKTHLLRAISTRLETPRCSVALVTASPLSQAVPLGVFTGTLPERWTSPAALIDHFTRHRATTVLLVDNVDQLDEASLFVVGQLIRHSRVPTVLTTRELAGAPVEVRALYDSGEIVEIAADPLTNADADELVAQTIGGTLTPEARPRVFDAARGIPLHLREILTASVDEGRLVRVEHGWELRGDPASTKRLAQLVGERFAGLDDVGLDAAAKIAIAGEYPIAALEAGTHRVLARAGVIEYSAPAWLRLSHPLDREFLRARYSDVLWMELCRDVMGVLLTHATAHVPAARRRAHILALDLGETVDTDAVLAVAQHSLGAFDERLALRAAEAVIAHDPNNPHAHRIAGLAASALGRSTDAAISFTKAKRGATTDAEHAAIAIAHARHLGLRHHDAAAALAVIESALATVTDPSEVGRVQRDALRWSVVAGHSSEVMDAPSGATDATNAPDAPGAPDAGAVLGLITVGVSAVITGPLDDAERSLLRLRQLPDEVVALIPGGAALIELTAIMALSNTGDVDAARRKLTQTIAFAELHAPESLGIWEYALGFSELLSGSLEQAYTVADAARAHLEWRDTTGLLPAAMALTGAAARATGRDAVASALFDAIPAAADNDPKVVMLRAWADAWQHNAEGRTESAARRLVDAARWLLTAQHTYFAGMLAHCAVRVGEHLAEAVAIIDEARQIAGGGLLELLARHGSATLAGDRTDLERIARETETLGLHSTASDIRRMVTSTAPTASAPTASASSPLALWSPQA